MRAGEKHNKVPQPPNPPKKANEARGTVGWFACTYGCSVSVTHIPPACSNRHSKNFGVGADPAAWTSNSGSAMTLVKMYLGRDRGIGRCRCRCRCRGRGRGRGRGRCTRRRRAGGHASRGAEEQACSR